VLKYSHPAIIGRLAKLAVRANLGSAGESEDALAQKFLDAVDALNRDLGIPTYLESLREEDIPELAAAACREAHFDMIYPVPRYMTQSVCEDLIRQVLPPEADAPAEKKAPRRRKVAA
jgi:alcohol dehydrogenase class IV